MEGRWVSTRVGELSRGDDITFRYLNGREVRQVRGWVDRIARRSIRVGNEYHVETDGKTIFHNRKYIKSKIEALRKIERKR